MLKLVKWAYDLGVRHERARIANFLELESQRSSSNRNSIDQKMNEIATSKKDYANKKRKKLEISFAVEQRVEQIIQAIFYEQSDWTSRGSVIFPEGKVK